MLITISPNQNDVFKLLPCPTNLKDFSLIITNNEYNLKKLWKQFDIFASKMAEMVSW